MNNRLSSISLIFFVSFVIVSLVILFSNDALSEDSLEGNKQISEPLKIVYPIRSLENGDSPYDEIFGKGIYNDTQNSILIKASEKLDVVFVLVDINTDRRIRNEFINKGSTFNLTKIPYGTYDYMYFSGNDWSDEIDLGIGVKGGFTRNSSFTKNSYSTDRIEFEQGYYGTYELTLYSVINGNLETESTSAQDFFN